MRSKTSYFNPTLFKKNLSRFWPLWGGASAIGALVPLYLLTELIREGFRSFAGNGLEVTIGYYSALAYIVPIISLFYAALCALAVWHYLYNARSVGLYHSLPITRRGLFLTNFLSGMAMMLIPYAVTGLLAIAVTLAAGCFEPVGVLVTVLGVLGESFFYFSAATLIVFVTGNPFAFAAFYFIFHFLAAGAEWLASELMTQFYFGVTQAYEGVIEFLSPTIYLLRNLEVDVDYQEIVTAGGWTDNGAIRSVTLQSGWLIAVYALVGAALLGCAWALYRRRRSESAGDVVAVGWMKPVFRYGVALCAALTGGTLLYALFCESFQTRTTASAVPMAVCMAIAGVVGYYIASMLLAKSLRVFRGSARGVLATAAASAAVCLLIAADPIGAQSWVPQAGEVSNVSVNFYGRYGRYIYADLDDPAAIQKALDVHQAIVSERDTLNRRSGRNFYEEGSVEIDLDYDLSGGRRVHRNYTLPVSETSLAQSEAVRQAGALASDPDVQEENIFRRVTAADVLEARLTGGYVGDVYNTETHEVEGVDLTLEQAKVLEAAVHRDIQAGRFGKTILAPTYEQYDQSVYFGDLQLNYNVTYQQEDHFRYIDGTYAASGTKTVSFTISVYCTETLKALEEIGVVDAAHRLIINADQQNIEWQEDGSQVYYDGPYGSDYPADAVVYPDGSVVYPDGARVTFEEIA